jgi:competence protein ComEA
MKRIIILAISSFVLFTHSFVFADVININKADVAALDKLNGIGAKKAESIIAWRDKHGEFKSLDAIKDVPGIGDKLFEKIKNDIALTDTTPSNNAASVEPAKVDTTASVAANQPATTATNNNVVVNATTAKVETAKSAETKANNAVSAKVETSAPANTSSNSSVTPPTSNTTVVADKKL